LAPSAFLLKGPVELLTRLLNRLPGGQDGQT
jgi:hypothetical protein